MEDQRSKSEDQANQAKQARAVGALAEARAAKRARFETSSNTSSRSPRLTPVSLALAAVVIAAFAVVAFLNGQSGTGSQSDVAQGSGSGPIALQTTEDGVIRLPASTFDDGKARHYAYDAGGQKVRFFVLKSSDGVVRAAFDACDVCYPARRGYHQEGDEMVCNNCGQRFPSIKVNEVRGGCNPAPLVRNVEGENVVIRASDITAEGARYFN